MSEYGGLTASSMVSDFTTDGRRRVAWHSIVNPSMSVFYPTIFHHDGLAAPAPAWLGSSAPWWGFRYVTYNLARDDLEKVKLVRDTWRPVQQRFFREAETLAEAADGMSIEDANAAIATFMSNVSQTMHDTLLHLNKTLPSWR